MTVQWQDYSTAQITSVDTWAYHWHINRTFTMEPDIHNGTNT